MMCSMPSIAHEAPLELLRGEPGLAAVLVQALGVPVPASAMATLVPADLTVPVPAEMRADAVVLLEGDGGRLAVITEVQLSWDQDKEFTWPAYLTQVRAAHRCNTVLLVICPDSTVAGRCRDGITTGHPGFDLTPLVIDSSTTPLPGQAGVASASPELVVLAVLTGALDLGQDSARRLVLASLAAADESRRAAYTVFVLTAASGAALQALENLMATAKFSHPFVDRFLDEGRAEGEARMILRVLAVRGLQVPDDVRERVLSCTDLAQLDRWGDRAVTAATVEDVFSA
jgi:hypothetical protein